MRIFLMTVLVMMSAGPGWSQVDDIATAEAASSEFGQQEIPGVEPVGSLKGKYRGFGAAGTTSMGVDVAMNYTWQGDSEVFAVNTNLLVDLFLFDQVAMGFGFSYLGIDDLDAIGVGLHPLIQFTPPRRGPHMEKMLEEDYALSDLVLAPYLQGHWMFMLTDGQTVAGAKMSTPIPREDLTGLMAESRRQVVTVLGLSLGTRMISVPGCAVDFKFTYLKNVSTKDNTIMFGLGLLFFRPTWI